MFIRENKNRSGSISVQVVQKVNGRNKVVFSAGSATARHGIELLKIKAQEFIDQHKGTIPLFVEKEDLLVQSFIDSLSNSNLRIVGPQVVLDPLYDSVFSLPEKKYFKDLVLCRIIYPGSKLRTVGYLSRHFNKTVSEQSIYRAMDSLDGSLKRLVEQCTYNRAVIRSEEGSLSLVFYDMTTLYFETESEDDLRKIGYSKDGKHQHPQIMIGLLVNVEGYPIAYDVFEGNTAETKTLIPVIERLVSRFGITKPVIVADSALLSKKNLESLQNNGYAYVLGGRIKNESREIKDLVLNLKTTEEVPTELPHLYGRLIVSYSEKRSRKDRHNREKGLKRLEKKVKTKKLTKEAINNRGYNKYLKLEGETKVTVDYEAFKADQVWDGLKGYVTNTGLGIKEVIGSYSNLWRVEKAFRMSKSDLRFRPVYHRKENRIKAHLLICFAAFALYKELEVKLHKNKINLSVQKAVEELKQVHQITYQLPKSRAVKHQLLKPTPVQKELLNMEI